MRPLLFFLVLITALSMTVKDVRSGIEVELQGLLSSADMPKAPPGLDSHLFHLWLQSQGAALPQAQPATPVPDAVQVVVEAVQGAGDAAAQAIVRLGGTVQARHHDLVQGVVPVARLMDLWQDETVLRLRPPFALLPAAVVSEGLTVVGAEAWHRAGLTGRGVKVAVIDVGFAGAEALRGRELPSDFVLRDFTSPRPPSPCTSGEEDVHGTAVAEIVHDMAPGAQLLLARVATDVEFAQAVDWALQQGAQVVNLSASSPDAPPAGAQAPGDVIGQAVDRAAQAGVFWANAAGNDAQRHWIGTATDADGDGLMEFAPGVELNPVRFPRNTISCVWIFLKWDEPWQGACTDYDLLVGYYDSFGQPRVLSIPDNTQDCSPASQPLESVLVEGPILTYDGALYVAVGVPRGAPPRRLQLLVVSDGGLAFSRPEGSVLPPADRASVVAVGAVHYSRPSTLEDFSSRGPTWDGRTKPDLVAPDGVSTVSYGYYGFPFFGTSAASPHVAGAAALVLQAHPDWTAQQVRQFLEGRARDLGPPGKDNLYGAGLLQMGEPPPAPSLRWGDVDCDGAISALDALMILRAVASLPVEVRGPCPRVGQEILWPR
jgi:subtilisin family serine protease